MSPSHTDIYLKTVFHGMPNLNPNLTTDTVIFYRETGIEYRFTPNSAVAREERRGEEGALHARTHRAAAAAAWLTSRCRG